MLVIACELLFRGATVPRTVSSRAVYPMAAFAAVGGAAQSLGESFYVYSSMYAATFFTAFLGPLVFAKMHAKAGKRRHLDN
ncbi:hypothetical protein G3O01_09755 [Burkholderia sp. Ac-20365]|nr:hypothetical protein [Burkholderia sp. Ac-20365]